jgi:broad specificity phosphatase PhoE
MRLLLIRHGQTPSNVAGALDTGFPGAGLTPLGEAQARAVPAALADETVAGVYASRLVRTQLTAAPLAEALGQTVGVREGFEEVSAGDFELRTESDAVQAYTGCLLGWMLGDLERRMPGGESGAEFLARYDAAVRALAAEHDDRDTVAVFSHGAAIRVFTTLAVGLAAEPAQELRILNTGMSVLEGSPGAGWELASWTSEPLGGLGLEDALAHDVTGESVEDVEDADHAG